MKYARIEHNTLLISQLTKFSVNQQPIYLNDIMKNMLLKTVHRFIKTGFNISEKNRRWKKMKVENAAVSAK